MNELWQLVESVFNKYSLVTALALIGVIIWVSYDISGRIARGRMHGSAIAILIGLLLAYIGGVVTGSKKRIADIECSAGIGLMGGAMLRDTAIVATAFGVRFEEFWKTGLSGIISLLVGVSVSFLIGTPAVAGTAVVIVIGVLMLVAGIIQIISGIRS